MNKIGLVSQATLTSQIVNALTHKSRSFFKTADMAELQSFVSQIIEAYVLDLAAHKSTRLRSVLNTFLPTFVDQGLLFNDIRLYCKLFRSAILEAENDQAAVNVSENWLQDLTLLSALYFNAQRENTIHQQQATLELQNNELREMEHTQQSTQAALRQVWIPIVALYPEIILVPLIGTVDSQRSAELTDRLLHTVESQAIRFVILDITGVQVVDTYIAQSLVKMSQAVKLLGAELSIVGIVPEIAQTIVQLGLDLSQISTYGSLSDGLQYALRQLNRRR